MSAREPILIEAITDGPSLPRQSRPLRLGLVGGGRIARVHVWGAHLTDRWELVAGALSSNAETARRAGRDWRLDPERCYASFEAMAAAEARRADGIEAVAITTPNESHHRIARAFLEAGIDVICDKPVTTTVEDALDLARIARRHGLVFGVTHAFAAYPMVRQAKAMIAAGAIGRIRQIHVEYFQEWLTGFGESSAKHVQWRMSPTLAGVGGTSGDIGTHAHHMACFVTGLDMTRLRAETHVCGSPKPLDDTVFVLARFGDGVPGTLIATQVAPGTFCAIKLRVFGDAGGLEWNQELPDFLKFDRFGEPAQIIRRGPEGGGVVPAAQRLTRVSRGTPEGLIEAWANLYAELAVAVAARRDGTPVPAGVLDYPTIDDGARGVRFVHAAIESSRADGAWTDCALQL